MENQHQKIKGYRNLSQSEIDLMNRIKEQGKELGELVRELEMIETFPNPLDATIPVIFIDKRWIAIGKTNLQQGIMALVRAVAKPESF